MKKQLLFIVISFTVSAQLLAQDFNEEMNNLKKSFVQAKYDSSRARYAALIGSKYAFSNLDSSIFYLDRAINIADKLGSLKLLASYLSSKGFTLLAAGKIPQSLEFQFEALKISEQLNDTLTKSIILNRIGNGYMELADYKKANEYYFLSKDLERKMSRLNYYNELSNIGNVFYLMKQKDSALYYQQIVLDTLQKMGSKYKRGFIIQTEVYYRMGNALKLNGDTIQAISFYKKGIIQAKNDNDMRNMALNQLFLGKLYMDMKLSDSGLKYTYNALESGKAASFRKGLYDASLLMSAIYEDKGKWDSAYKYLSLSNAARDSIFGPIRIQEMQRIMLTQQEMQQQVEKDRADLRNQNRLLAFSLAILLAALLTLYLWYNIRKQKKVNSKLLEQKTQISLQNHQLEKTLQDLKQTQSQLVQSEKMASLGELTAGIAHEIQNPLNFVNNFSELNKELLSEMNDELTKGNFEEALSLARDVTDNEDKIMFHGKRADAIVKGMLQHSRSSSGEKSLTDINALCDEYLRLSYHGLRAKDKSFNAMMKTDFDESIGKINIIPQDIGRVILNLINNAFYAAPLPPEGGFTDPSYKHEPTVSIRTEKAGDKVLISVRDNGPGIPKKILDKIFQPFFTTKPTGQGTGLGLSLSYDIVKAHGGELNVISKERKGAEFIITLPLTDQKNI